MAKDNKESEAKEPCMVKSHDVKLDAEYAEWIAEVKHRYRSAQMKAAVKVNARICHKTPTVRWSNYAPSWCINVERMELLQKELRATKRLMRKTNE